VYEVRRYTSFIYEPVQYHHSALTKWSQWTNRVFNTYGWSTTLIIMSTWREPFIVKRNINQNDKIDNIWNFKINNFSFLDNYKLHKSLEGDISALWEIHTDLWYNVSIKEPLMTRVRFTFPKHLVLIVIEIRVVSADSKQKYLQVEQRQLSLGFI
jgi:hypothetical protein